MSFIDNIKKIPITDYAQRCGFTLVKKGERYYSLKEHDSVRIDIHKNCFWRNSVFQKGVKGGAGSIIDFAIEFMGYEKNKALRELALMYGVGNNNKPTIIKENALKSTKKREVGDLDLPPKAQNYKAVYRYLIKERGINVSVVRYFVAKNMLYQDKLHNNCVFVSKNFACVRSTSGKKFAIDVKGCDYNECFFFRPSNKANTLIVTEGVIDIMSIMTQFIRNNNNFSGYSYLALAGTNKLPSLFYHLKKEKNINIIWLAFDNDEAGSLAQETAFKKLQEINFSGQVKPFNPPVGKDWNDYINFK